jgi:polyisoprenoid-binding protein YceI
MALELFTIDPAHSVIGFSIRHMVIAKVRGSFTRFHGTVELDGEDVTCSRVEVWVDAASVDTNEPDRDAHLRSADFFDVERYPEITFLGTHVEVLDDTRLDVSGDLTLHGVTREFTLATTFGGRAIDPWGSERIGFGATASLDRREFGLVWNAPLEAGGVLVGNVVDAVIEVEAVRAPAADSSSL